MATMKAARWHAAKDVRIQEIEVPEVLPHQVKVAVKFTGICGTDLHEFLDGPIFIPTDEHVYSGQKAPVTLGHEFSGEIIEVGSDITRVKVGDRVAVEPILAKNNLVGDYNLDPNLNFVGLAADGGFAKYCVLDGDLVHVIPDSLSYEQAALTEPAAVAVYAVRQSSLKAGDTAVVFGLGPIGLLIVEALRAAGASKIYAVEAIHRLTNGGVDVSYEVTGVPVVLGQALAAVHKAGECMVVSIWEREANINPNEFAIQEKTLKGIIAYRHIFPKVLELMEQGYFSAEKLVTKKIKLENIVEEGFIELTQDKSQIKILVEPE
ncbi:L-iditol 2-dehydrogenase [Streptococcus pneumoniae]|nr:L-iditol 2-dehydrogenase [Streptococcus pneumoniae]